MAKLGYPYRGNQYMLKNNKFLILIGMISVMICACGKKVESKEDTKVLSFPDITAEDLEVINYINQNSDFVFELFGEMDIAEKGPEAPYTEISDDTTIYSYGFYIEEKQAVIRTQIV